jgi:26S proteasome non-ATPase regulatory subunit 10
MPNLNSQYTKPVVRATVSVQSIPTHCPHTFLGWSANHRIIANKVEALLNANPKLAALRDDDDRLPIHWAVSYNNLPIVQILVQAKNFDVDVADGSGWTPLMMACSRKDAEAMVDLLLSKDAEVNAKNNNGQTALHFCASKANLDIARTLLAQKPPASARIKDKRGQLALHRAAAVGNVPMIKELLGAGKSPLNATDVDGMTALHHAISEGHGDTALLLLTSGAEFDKQDRDGKVALDYAPDAKTRKFIVQAAEREGVDLE